MPTVNPLPNVGCSGAGLADLPCGLGGNRVTRGYLHLAADAGVVVVAYDDSAEGTMLVAHQA